ncbi:MAG: DUF1015 domain-containing protein [Clostridiales bacterium]|nr:DUF1015 domain-containing protein [Clostridiales bacterium]
MLSPIDSSLPIAAPEILLPAEGTDYFRWSVIACDQFTSEPEYWSETRRIVGNAPSTLHMVLPEVYLDTLSDSAIDEKIIAINRTIDDYLHQGRFRSLPAGFIVLDRSTTYTSSRKGLMLAIDLERYDFTPGTKQPVRATEGTVLSRIPPRVRIRENAPIELPHIMVLFDDPHHTVIEPALEALSSERPVYDTSLMQDGGHVRGYFCDEKSDVAQAIQIALLDLFEQSDDGFLFAVGDGNHSLATAKAHWENVRETLDATEHERHPARFAMVEAVNIHDDGLDFEPIHRIAYGLSMNDFITYAKEYFKDSPFSFQPIASSDSIGSSDDIHKIRVTDGAEDHLMTLENPQHALAVGSLQCFLDKTAESHPEIRIDYIHGEDSVRILCDTRSIGFILPDVSKDSFFRTISKAGVFPRKTFSMGHAQEKRYYLEAKMITNAQKEVN